MRRMMIYDDHVVGHVAMAIMLAMAVGVGVVASQEAAAAVAPTPGADQQYFTNYPIGYWNQFFAPSPDGGAQIQLPPMIDIDGDSASPLPAPPAPDTNTNAPPSPSPPNPNPNPDLNPNPNPNDPNQKIPPPVAAAPNIPPPAGPVVNWKVGLKQFLCGGSCLYDCAQHFKRKSPTPTTTHSDHNNKNPNKFFGGRIGLRPRRPRIGGTPPSTIIPRPTLPTPSTPLVRSPSLPTPSTPLVKSPSLPTPTVPRTPPALIRSPSLPNPTTPNIPLLPPGTPAGSRWPRYKAKIPPGVKPGGCLAFCMGMCNMEYIVGSVGTTSAEAQSQFSTSTTDSSASLSSSSSSSADIYPDNGMNDGMLDSTSTTTSAIQNEEDYY